jgi:hypothetical protein
LKKSLQQPHKPAFADSGAADDPVPRGTPVRFVREGGQRDVVAAM